MQNCSVIITVMDASEELVYHGIECIRYVKKQGISRYMAMLCPSKEESDS